MNNKEIVEQLKQSISYRSKHKKFIDKFLIFTFNDIDMSNAFIIG